MVYIIDANNLAGKLGVLKEKEFDKKLIEMIKSWSQGKKHKIYLVFDSLDIMGEKFKNENVNVIYAPRDSYHNSADDKIIELIDMLAPKSDEEIIFVTDDNDLIEKVKSNKITLSYKQKIISLRATEFARKLNYFFETGAERENEKLSDDEIDAINDELLKIWK